MSAALPGRTTFLRGRRFRWPGSVLAKRNVQLAFATLLVLLIAVLATGFIATVNLYRSAEDRYVHVALPLRTLTRDVLFRITQEETGVRGYMITTNRASLDPYLEGRDALAADLVQIRQLTNGRPALEHVSEAVIVVDVDERVRYWNPAAEQLFGIDADHAVGQPVRGIVVDYNELVEAADHGDAFVPVMIDGAERWFAPVVSEFDGGS